MSEKKNNNNNPTAQAQAIPTQPTPAPVQEPVTQPTPAPALTPEQEALIAMIKGMSPEQIKKYFNLPQTPTPASAPAQEPAQAIPTPTPEPVTEYYEVPAGMPVNFVNNVYTTEGGRNNMDKNTKVIDTRKGEFERDLNRAGLSKMEVLDLVAKGRACGEFGTNDVLSIQKRADILRDFDRREQAHLDAQLRRAELEAKAKSESKKGLTTGQKVWIGIGIAAVVLIVGGAVWYLIQKKKSNDAFAEDFAEETASRCDRIFAARGLAI